MAKWCSVSSSVNADQVPYRDESLVLTGRQEKMLKTEENTTHPHYNVYMFVFMLKCLKSSLQPLTHIIPKTPLPPSAPSAPVADNKQF